jgi:hypothetical protein
MTTNLQQGTLLDVLKKKMRQTKEEMERYKDECEEYNRKFQLESMRREEVSGFVTFLTVSLIFGAIFNEFQSRSGYFFCWIISMERGRH